MFLKWLRSPARLSAGVRHEGFPAGGKGKPVRYSPRLEVLEDRICPSIQFSAPGAAAGYAFSGTVNSVFNETISAMTVPGGGDTGTSPYTFSVENTTNNQGQVLSGWSLPPGLSLLGASFDASTSTMEVANTTSFTVTGTPTQAGQYNVAFRAKDTTGFKENVVYQFNIAPAGSFRGTIGTTNSTVLPLATINQLYSTTINISGGTLSGVNLLTQSTDGSLISAVDDTQSPVTPVPGLVANAPNANVTNVSQTTGAVTSGANVAGLTIMWTSSSVTISGTPTISVGGVNDPLLLQLSDTAGDPPLYFNFAIGNSVQNIATAYGFNSIPTFGTFTGKGAGQTVVIMSIGDNSAFVSSTDPNFANSDLNQFDLAESTSSDNLATFNQPGGPVFLKLAADGSTNYPAQAIGSGEDPDEVPQDIEWVHALAPLANIIVLEGTIDTSLQTVYDWVTNNGQAPPLPAGVAAPTVVTSSFGAASLNAIDNHGIPSAIYAPGVTYVASSGDFTGGSGRPADEVVEAGYTQMPSNSSYQEDAVVGGTMPTTGHTFQSGGGVVPPPPQPNYQVNVPNTSTAPNPVPQGTGGRTFADVGFNGSEASGDQTYNSFENTTPFNFKTPDELLITGVSNSVDATITISPNGSSGLEPGDIVTISDVLGATGVNGTWTVLSIVSPTQFKINNTSAPGVYNTNSDAGVSFANNFAFGGSPWSNAWGTSMAAPSWAALFAIVDEGRMAAGNSSLDGFSQTLPMLYSLAGATDFNQISGGINQTTQAVTPICCGTEGSSLYNIFTGLGTPRAQNLVPDLIGPRLTPDTNSLGTTATSLTIQGSSFPTAGATYTVAFFNSSGTPLPGVTGTVAPPTSSTELTVTNLSGLTTGPLFAVVTATVKDSNGNILFTDSSGLPVEVANVAGTTPPIGGGGALFAVGAGAGGGPQVVVYNAGTGAVVASFYAFAPSFTGGVRVAVDDVNGDGTEDVICAAGPGGGPQIVVIDGTKLSQVQSNGEIAASALLASFYAFAPAFTGGVYVAAGTSSSGQNWIVAGAGAGGGPQVVVWTSKAILAGTATGTAPTPLASFYAFAPGFTGGVTVAVGDVNGDGKLDVIAGAGPGAGPQVIVVDGTRFSQIQSNGILPLSTLLASFYAFAPGFTGGVFVSGGVTSGTQFNLILGAGAGTSPQVLIVNGAQVGQLASNGQIAASAVLDSFFALSSNFSGGVRVGFSAAYGSSVKPAILTAAGPGGGPQVAPFDGATFAALTDFFALPHGFTGGLFIAG